MSEPLLSIFNNHAGAVGCGDPPIVNNSDPAVYVGYFENKHGEQWVFTYDRESNRAELRGGDIGWNNPAEIVEGQPDDLILSQPELAWLIACWAGATGRFPDFMEPQHAPPGSLNEQGRYRS
jgi:hypothetical protein